MAEWLTLAQFISSTSVAMVGLIVAVVAAVIGYGNAFGWKPFLFVRTHALIPRKNPEWIGVYVEFELWNRRKYPVVIRNMDV